MTTENLPQDVAFRLLSHAHRRALLECLDRHDVPLAMSDVAKEVARTNRERSISEIPDRVIDEIYLSLYHSHVPRLAANDAVSYDAEREVVALTERGERLVAIHERLTSAEPLEVADFGEYRPR